MPGADAAAHCTRAVCSASTRQVPAPPCAPYPACGVLRRGSRLAWRELAAEEVAPLACQVLALPSAAPGRSGAPAARNAPVTASSRLLPRLLPRSTVTLRRRGDGRGSAPGVELGAPPTSATLSSSPLLGSEQSPLPPSARLAASAAANPVPGPAPASTDFSSITWCAPRAPPAPANAAPARSEPPGVLAREGGLLGGASSSLPASLSESSSGGAGSTLRSRGSVQYSAQ